MVLAEIRNFKNQTYPPKPAPFTEADVKPSSQDGRVFIVTGGSSGIGFELCRILYNSGATIYLAARSKDRADAAIKTITDDPATTTHGTLKFLPFDLNDLESVTAAATSFAAQESKLDVLWNNAGQGGNRVKLGQRTVQDFEPMVGMHCIATLLFTTLLLPQLRAAVAVEKTANNGVATGKTRVIWISSGTAESNTPKNGIEFDKLENGKDLIYNYAISRLGEWFLGREMARRYGAEGILSLPVNPGNLRSNSWEGTPAVVMFIINHLILHNVIYGTYTELYAGLSPELSLKDNGVHIIPWGRIHPDDKVLPRQDLIKAMKPVEEGGLGYAARFWDWCEEKFRPYV